MKKCIKINYLKVGERLRNLRKKKLCEQKKGKKKCDSIEALAEKLDIAPETLKKWEAGKVLPSTDGLLILADYYGKDIDYLLCRMDEPTHDIKNVADITGLSAEAVDKFLTPECRVEDSKNNIMHIPLNRFDKCECLNYFAQKSLYIKAEALNAILISPHCTDLLEKIISVMECKAHLIAAAKNLQEADLDHITAQNLTDLEKNREKEQNNLDASFWSATKIFSNLIDDIIEKVNPQESPLSKWFKHCDSLFDRE